MRSTRICRYRSCRRRASSARCASSTTGSCSATSSSTRRDSSAYASGSLYRKLVSSSSSFTLNSPSRRASGAKTCSVSSAMRFCLCGGMLPSVRMLCSRSASFTTMMRTSSVIDSSSCCRSTAFTSTLAPPSVSLPILLNLVSPSTMRRAAKPKRASMPSNVMRSVSSTLSCSSPAMSESRSIRSSARMRVTSTGCVMYGSPLLRIWPSWHANASSSASRTAARSRSPR
mmetsp:Transcript_2298/g.5737  ORF Transcript_2298/g.5737 Transcript_2298/m.5737 type:complete len:229 (-) Transcript_2298:151-837(-)